MQIKKRQITFVVLVCVVLILCNIYHIQTQIGRERLMYAVYNDEGIVETHTVLEKPV